MLVKRFVDYIIICFYLVYISYFIQAEKEVEEEEEEEEDVEEEEADDDEWNSSDYETDEEEEVIGDVDGKIFNFFQNHFIEIIDQTIFVQMNVPSLKILQSY